LIELLVTLAVVGVLTAVAMPQLGSLMAGRAASSAADDLAESLRLARSEAIKRGMPVSVCSTADPNATTLACATTASWRTGWVMFADQDNNGTLASTEAVIKVFKPNRTTGTITEDNANTFLWFQSNGLAMGGGTASRRFLIRPNLPTANASYASLTRTVCLKSTGRVTVLSGVATCP